MRRTLSRWMSAVLISACFFSNAAAMTREEGKDVVKTVTKNTCGSIVRMADFDAFYTMDRNLCEICGCNMAEIGISQAETLLKNLQAEVMRRGEYIAYMEVLRGQLKSLTSQRIIDHMSRHLTPFGPKYTLVQLHSLNNAWGSQPASH